MRYFILEYKSEDLKGDNFSMFIINHKAQKT
jgi:hypothetical protein